MACQRWSNIILNVPAELGVKLLKHRNKKTGRNKKDIHEEDPKHLKDTEKAYLEIAKLFPNTKLIECVHKGALLSLSEIHNKVWDLVRRITLKDINKK